jgi:predicted phosphoadenosine phosphosulfate sulfurtransferase
MAKKIFNVDKNVLIAAQERLAFVFDNFEHVCISLSGGKDSTVLFHLAYEEAQRRGVALQVLIIDLEGQYRLTIEHLHELVDRPGLEVHWVCLPLNLRNGCSVFDPHWCCWEPGLEKYWVRKPPSLPCVVTSQEHYPFYRYRMEFEEFIEHFPRWLSERLGSPIAQLVGIRADESTNRYNAVKVKPNQPKKSAWNGVQWSAVNGKDPNIASFFPIYDWRFNDIWAYFGKTNYPHNPLYDRMHLAGVSFKDMRICQPYGDDQKKGLDVWHMMEPETWERIVNRVTGANYGALYASGKMLGYHRGLGLPDGHTWKSYTFFLLSTLPDVMREKMLSNYAVFLEWYQRHGYPDLSTVPDFQADKSLETKHQAPSWRRLAMAILKNDFWCKSLSIGMIKDVRADVYDRVANGEPVKVRKSVKPVYDFLRSEYQSFLESGIDGVSLEMPASPVNPIKEKYASL